MDQIPGADALPSVLASLGLRKKPDLSDWQDEDTHRIHYAVRVLKHTGYQPVAGFVFDQYICGPYAENLDSALEGMNWDDVDSALELDDSRLDAVREAVQKGDDFLLALSMTVGIHDRNQGISKIDTMGQVTWLMPDLEPVAEAAYDFAEARIWPK